MRFSRWFTTAPFKASVAPKVLAVIGDALGALGADADPECWVAWGDDPSVRYLMFVPTQSGLVQVNVRVGGAGQGPRATGKVIRWNRVQFGELAVEVPGGHRLVTFQVEGQVLSGADAAADAISAFAQSIFAAVDGRPISPVTRSQAKRPAAKSRSVSSAKPATRSTRSSQAAKGT
jgi:hypothetical protein